MKSKRKTCPKCLRVNKVIRVRSGLCTMCDAKSRTGCRVEDDRLKDHRLTTEIALRTVVVHAMSRLLRSWNTVGTPEDLRERELAAWDLIETVENLLGKE